MSLQHLVAEAEAKAQRVLDDLEDKMLAEQEAAAAKDTPRSEAVTHDGAQPAAASQTEPAAPVATVTPIRKERPSDTQIIAAIAKAFDVNNSQAARWIIEVAEAMEQAA